MFGWYYNRTLTPEEAKVKDELRALEQASLNRKTEKKLREQLCGEAVANNCHVLVCTDVHVIIQHNNYPNLFGEYQNGNTIKYSWYGQEISFDYTQSIFSTTNMMMYFDRMVENIVHKMNSELNIEIQPDIFYCMIKNELHQFDAPMVDRIIKTNGVFVVYKTTWSSISNHYDVKEERYIVDDKSLCLMKSFLTR